MAHGRPMGRTGAHRSGFRQQLRHRDTHRALLLRRTVGVERDLGRMTVAAAGCRQGGRSAVGCDSAAHRICAPRRIRTAARRVRIGGVSVAVAAGADGMLRRASPPYAGTRERGVRRPERRRQIDGEQCQRYVPFRSHVFVFHSVSSKFPNRSGPFRLNVRPRPAASGYRSSTPHSARRAVHASASRRAVASSTP